MAVIGEAQVRILPETAGFAAEAEGGILGGLHGIVAKGAAILGGLFVAKEAISGFSSLVGAGEALTKQQTLVKAALLSTGNAANVNVPALQAYADAQAAVTGNSAQAVTQLQQVLLRFTNIRNEIGQGNDIFTQAQTAIQNVAGALGKGLQPSAIAVGKALQDPTTGLTSLQRLGIQFTKSQKDMLKELLNTGNGLEAQKFILETLSQRYGGAGAAAATFTEKLKAELQNAKDLAGQAIEPAIGAITTGLLPVIPEIGRVLGSAVSAVIPAITPALKEIGPVLQSVVTGLAPIFATLGTTLAKAFGGLAPVFNSFALLLVQLSPLFRPIASAVGLMAQTFSAVATPAIQGFTAIIGDIAKSVLPLLQGAFKVLSPIILEVAHVFGDTFGAALDTVAPIIGQIAGILATTLADALRAIAPVIPPIAQAFAQFAAFAADAGIAFLQSLLPGLEALLGALTPLLPPLTQVAVMLATTLANAIKAVGPAVTQLATALGKTLADVLVALAPALPGLAKALTQLAVAFASLVVAVTPALVTLVNFGTTLITSIGAPVLIAVATAVADVANALLPLISNTQVLTPILAFLATLWAVDKITVFVQTIHDAATAVTTFATSLSFSRFTSFISGLLGIGDAAEVSAAAMLTAQQASVAIADEISATTTARVAAATAAAAAEHAEAVATQELVVASLELTGAEQALAAVQAEIGSEIGLTDAAMSALAFVTADVTAAQERFAAAETAAAVAARENAASQAALAAAVEAEGVAVDTALASSAAGGAAIAGSLAASVGIVAAIVAAFVASVVVVKEFIDKVNSIGGAVKVVGNALATAFAPAQTLIVTEIEHFGELLGFVESIPGAIASAASAVGNFFGSLGGSIGTGVSGAFGAVVSFFNDLPGEIGGAIAAAASAIAGFFTSLGPTIVGALSSTVSSIAGVLPGLLLAIVQEWANLPTQIAGALAFGAGFVVGALTRIAIIVVQSLPGAFVAVVDFFRSLPGRLADAVSSATSALTSVGAEIIDVIATGLTAGVPAVVSAVVNEFDALPGQIGNILSSIPGIVANALGSTGSAIGGALGGAGSAVGGALGNIGSTAGSALATAGSAAINGLVTGAQASISAVVAFFSALPGVVVAAAGDASTWLHQVGIDVINGLIVGIEAGAAAIGNFFVTIVQKFVAGFEAGFGIASPATTMIPIGVAILQGIVQGALNAVGSLLGFIGGLPGRVLGALGNVGVVMASAGVDLIDGIVRGAQVATGTLLAFVGGIPGRAAGLLTAGVGLFANVGRDMISAFVNGVNAAANTLFSVVGSLIPRAVAAIGDVTSVFTNIGSEIINGIAQGIRNAPGVIEGALHGLLSDAVSFGKSILGISSPSTVFAQQVGLPIPQGIAQGIGEGATLITGAVATALFKGAVATRQGLAVMFDPNAPQSAVQAFMESAAADVLNDKHVQDALNQAATDAKNVFNKVLKDNKDQINATLAAENLPALPSLSGSATAQVTEIGTLFLGAATAAHTTTAEIRGLLDVTQAFDLHNVSEGASQLSGALQAISEKGAQLGITGTQFDTLRTTMLAFAGASPVVIDAVNRDLGGIEKLVGAPLGAQQIDDLTTALGNLQNAAPGSQQITDALGNVNLQAEALGISGTNLLQFQQDALRLGGASGSVQEIATALGQLNVAAASAAGTLSGSIDQAFQAAAASGAHFGAFTGDLTTFMLGLHGSSLQAADSLQTVATNSIAAALGIQKAGGSTADAKAAIDQGVSSVIALATHLGLTGQQAVQYAAQLFGIPAARATTITTPGALEAIVNADNVKGAIDGIPSSKTITFAALDGVSGIIDSITHKFESLANTQHFHISATGQLTQSPTKTYEDWGLLVRDLAIGFQRNIDKNPTPNLPIAINTADVAGASSHPLGSAGAAAAAVISAGFAASAPSATVQINASVNTASAKAAAVQLSGTIDQLVSSAVGALPTVSAAVSNFMQAYTNAFDAATKANAAFSAAQKKLIADTKAGVDEATIFLDTDAVNKAASAQKDAISKLRAAADPTNFVDSLKARNDQITELQSDLTKLLKLGDTALAAEIASQGTAGLKLAQALSSNGSAAAQAEKLISQGDSLQSKFSQFLTTTFGPDFTGAASTAGTDAGTALANAISGGLLGVLPAARAIVGQLGAALSDPSITSGLTRNVSAAQNQLSQVQLNPSAITPVAAANAVNASQSPNAPIEVTLNITIENPDGTTSKATGVPVSVPRNPTSIIQDVTAKAQQQ